MAERITGQSGPEPMERSGADHTGIDERLYQVLDRSVAFAALLTPEGRLKHISQNALDLSGAKPEEALGRPVWETCWWAYDPDAQARMRKTIELAAAGTASRYDASVHAVGGPRLTLDLQVSPLLAPDGSVRELVASAIDISERVAIQRKLEELIREMTHRIKNLLTTVLAMARMTQRTSAPDAAFRDFSGRLEALNVAHDALGESHTAQDYFEQLTQRLLRPYRESTGATSSRLTISGPRLELTQNEAKVLALCLYELATNAVKYGALSNSTGRVSVALSTPDDNGLTTFVWDESGGPPVTSPKRQGYGTQFVTTALEGIFGSEVAREYRPEGLRLTICGPAPSLFVA